MVNGFKIVSIPNIKISKTVIFHNNWRISGGTETASFFVMADKPLHLEKLEICEMHPYINEILVEPLKLLDPLVRSNMVDSEIPKVPDFNR